MEISQIDRAVQLLTQSTRTVFFTGAGVSTESGLPDYRGPDGVWTTGKIPSVGTLPKDDESRLEFWRKRREMYPYMSSREPNAGHVAIRRLMSVGHGLAVITQNIDGLHQKSGVPSDRVLELHGSVHAFRCMPNGHSVAGDFVSEKLEGGDPDPRCPVCGGPLRTTTVLFGESMPEEPLRNAAKLSVNADLMIVVGSSLVVYPAAQLPQMTKQHGGKLIIIDRAETALDALADLVIRGEAGPVLTTIADRVLEEKT